MHDARQKASEPGRPPSVVQSRQIARALAFLRWLAARAPEPRPLPRPGRLPTDNLPFTLDLTRPHPVSPHPILPHISSVFTLLLIVSAAGPDRTHAHAAKSCHSCPTGPVRHASGATNATQDCSSSTSPLLCCPVAFASVSIALCLKHSSQPPALPLRSQPSAGAARKKAPFRRSPQPRSTQPPRAPRTEATSTRDTAADEFVPPSPSPGADCPT